MKFVKANYDDIDMTCLIGYLEVTYDQLVHVFGEPHDDGDGYKIDAHWRLRFENGMVATIYNWKNGHNYAGDEGVDVEDIDRWHLGGHRREVVGHVLSALNAALR